MIVVIMGNSKNKISLNAYPTNQRHAKVVALVADGAKGSTVLDEEQRLAAGLDLFHPIAVRDKS
jgi:hypothetical protein